MRMRYQPIGKSLLLFERYTGSLGRMAGAMPATRIANLLGCSETTVRNLLKALEDVGQILVAPALSRLCWHGAQIFLPETGPSSEEPGGTRNRGYPGGGYRK